MGWIRSRDIPQVYSVCQRTGEKLAAEFKRWPKAEPDMFLRIGRVILFDQDSFEQFLRWRNLKRRSA